MSILDDAIREHLELKRAHGADDSEVKRLEDEAFGPPQRPDEIDPFAEAPTEFLMSPVDTPAEAPEIGDEGERTGRRPDIADLQEPPPAPAPFGVEDEHSPAPDAPPPSPTDAAEVPLPPPPDEAPAADLAPPTVEAALPVTEAPAPPTDEVPLPAEEERPAGEHEAIVDAGPSTEERHAIADQPTQMFDVQAHVEAEAAAPATGEQASPTDEELVDAVQEEPHAAPPAPEEPIDPPLTEVPEQAPLEIRGPDAEVAGHPPAEAEPEEGSSEFDFFNEQRLSDELDQALEAPLPPTDEHLAMPRYEDAPAPDAQGAIFDFESHGETETYEEDPSQEVLRRADEAEAAEEPFEEPPAPAAEAPPAAPEPPSEELPRGSTEPASVGEGDNEFDPDTGHEDVLEDTPRFLEDAPEDDDLWFEQKPPKDFDLD
jgi:hypothetical protein